MLCQDRHIPEYPWTCWSYAAVLLERKGSGDHLRPQELLEESLQISTDLGMPPLRQQADDSISRAGETPASGIREVFPNERLMFSA